MITRMMLKEQAIDAANEQLEGATAEERVRWALEHLAGRIVLSTSFGVQAAVMLHLVSRQQPDIPVIFIDTGYLFPETYRFAHEVAQLLNLNLKKYQATMSAAEMEALYGKLWEQGLEGLEKYNYIRKVEPMERALREHKADAWFAGLRRSQARTRKELPVLKQQNGVLKVHPIIDWSDRDIYLYLKAHDLPYNPLWEEGYVSVGDIHSTSRLADGMTAEQTRFNGLKRECGLHEVGDRRDFSI